MSVKSAADAAAAVEKRAERALAQPAPVRRPLAHAAADLRGAMHYGAAAATGFFCVAVTCWSNHACATVLVRQGAGVVQPQLHSKTHPVLVVEKEFSKTCLVMRLFAVMEAPFFCTANVSLNAPS